MRKILFLLLVHLASLLCFQSRAHPSGKIHVAEMYSVLPFAATESGAPTSENRAIKEWLTLITSTLIDNYHGEPCKEFNGLCFYDYMKAEFGFGCKHRLLFHWGFNARPWCDDLERKIAEYSWFSNPSEVTRFKEILKTEQARRNKTANAATEKLFGFASSGKEAAWANGIIAIMYDVHLLGDWVPYDNKDFDGVTPPSVITGDIINALRRIDSNSSRPLEKELSAITKKGLSEQQMAEELIAKLQQRLPAFLLAANEGALKRRFESRGFTFKDLSAASTSRNSAKSNS